MARIDDFELGQHVTFTKTFTEEDVQHFIAITSADRAKHRLVIDAWIENEARERVIEGVCEAGLLR